MKKCKETQLAFLSLQVLALATEERGWYSYQDSHVQQKSKSRSKIICHYYSKAGRIKRKHRKFKKEGKIKENDEEIAANIASDGALLVAEEAEICLN